MKFMQENSGNSLTIQGYEKGQVIINGASYHSSLIVTPSKVITQWRPVEFSDLTENDFIPLIDLQPEMILLGTGASHKFPHPSLTRAIMQQRIGLDAMNTAAACRTYNILMAEGRRVAAALFMI
ncbi:MAG: Mth938-like domain-containing protein [Pseudomonadota bacterium]